jgi:hypothetical protein
VASTDAVAAALGELLETTEDDLYRELAIRSSLLQHAPASAGSFAADPHEVDRLVLPEGLREIGKRAFERMNYLAWDLVCGSDESAAAERAKVVAALGEGRLAAATALAMLLIWAGVAPLIAPVLAALIVKLVLQPTHEATCEVWKERLGL